MHTQSIQGGFRDIKKDCVYIHQQIDDVLRDPNLDMLRQAAKRIEFTLRRIKWDFEHLTGLYEDVKRKAAELEKALEEARAAAAAAAAAGTDTETDVSVIGTDEGTEAATVVGSDVGSDDTTDVATEADSDGIETPTGSESPSDVDSVIDDVSVLVIFTRRLVHGLFF